MNFSAHLVHQMVARFGRASRNLCFEILVISGGLNQCTQHSWIYFNGGTNLMVNNVSSKLSNSQNMEKCRVQKGLKIILTITMICFCDPLLRATSMSPANEF